MNTNKDGDEETKYKYLSYHHKNYGRVGSNPALKLLAHYWSLVEHVF